MDYEFAIIRITGAQVYQYEILGRFKSRGRVTYWLRKADDLDNVAVSIMSPHSGAARVTGRIWLDLVAGRPPR